MKLVITVELRNLPPHRAEDGPSAAYAKVLAEKIVADLDGTRDDGQSIITHAIERANHATGYAIEPGIREVTIERNPIIYAVSE